MVLSGDGGIVILIVVGAGCWSGDIGSAGAVGSAAELGATELADWLFPHLHTRSVIAARIRPIAKAISRPSDLQRWPCGKIDNARIVPIPNTPRTIPKIITSLPVLFASAAFIQTRPWANSCRDNIIIANNMLCKAKSYDSI